jgi:hypothetical protein
MWLFIRPARVYSITTRHFVRVRSNHACRKLVSLATSLLLYQAFRNQTVSYVRRPTAAYELNDQTAVRLSLPLLNLSGRTPLGLAGRTHIDEGTRNGAPLLGGLASTGYRRGRKGDPYLVAERGRVFMKRR